MSPAADLCTGLRILLSPLFAWTLAQAHGETSVRPLAICIVAMLTDLADGRLARASGHPRPSGRLFDHGADALFLFPGLMVLANAGRLPIILPIAAILAFTLYLGDGWWRGRAEGRILLEPSRTGAAAGVANYTIAAGAAGMLWLGAGTLDRAVYAAALAAAALNLAAAFDRTHTWRRS
jgi:phosphatidylglycerophosphate synthase